MQTGKSYIAGIAYCNGSPINVSMNTLNIPTATLVFDYTNKVLYFKTSTTDNSAFSTLAFAGSQTLTLPTIASGLLATGSVANDFSGSTGAFKTSTGVSTFGGSANNMTNSLTFTTATSGVVLKQGANGLCGTFVANGATPVTVTTSAVAITDAIVISLNTVGGTVGVQPHVATITAATGFTVVCTASDTSTYNWAIAARNAA